MFIIIVLYRFSHIRVLTFVISPSSLAYIQIKSVKLWYFFQTTRKQTRIEGQSLAKFAIKATFISWYCVFSFFELRCYYYGSVYISFMFASLSWRLRRHHTSERHWMFRLFGRAEARIESVCARRLKWQIKVWKVLRNLELWIFN